MGIRTRKAIDTLSGITMTVRTTTGTGASYEKFRPCSLDKKGAMILLHNKADLDSPLRVTLNAEEQFAREYATKFGRDASSLRKNKDGTFQIFGIWLKVQWVKVPDAENIQQMGYNKLLWDIHDKLDSGFIPFVKNAKKLLSNNITSDIDTLFLLEKIANEEPLEYPLSQKGLHQLSRHDGLLPTKMLYCLVAGFSYRSVAVTIADFEARYMLDPFRKNYGVMHGTMALNQGKENWEDAYHGLQELTRSFERK